MRVARTHTPTHTHIHTYTAHISARASANNFSHPENRWPVHRGRIGGIYAHTHLYIWIYACVCMCTCTVSGPVFFPISFPTGIFICYGLEFRLVCLQRARTASVCAITGGHTHTRARARSRAPRVKNRDLAALFSPSSSNSSSRPSYYFPSTLRPTCPGVYITWLGRAHVIIISLTRACGTGARGFRSKKYPS